MSHLAINSEHKYSSRIEFHEFQYFQFIILYNLFNTNEWL